MNKKSQEEMVGFVLIVVLVTVIMVIFLGIYALKKPDIQSRDSDLLESFTRSISYYTSECQDQQNRYRNIEDLIYDCYDSLLCKDNTNSCEFLERTLRGIMNQSYIVKEGSFTKYYNMSLIVEGTGQRLLIKEITAGSLEQCNGPRFYNERRFVSSGRDKIIMYIEVCNTELE